MVAAIKRCFFLAFIATACPSSFAAVSAVLSEATIDELETVRLTIKITETRQSQNLDLAALATDFHIMSTNTVSQSRFLNGRGQSWVDYQITLQPKRTGILTIPSITVGVEQTPSLELNVRPLSNQTRQVIESKVFFENEISAETVYVQGQVILTRRLLYSSGVQLFNDLPGAPEIADAVVLTLGETISGTAERRGTTYGVVQQQYAIFPETSGAFEIPGINITASIRLVENGRTSRKGVRVGTDTQTITVLPVPAIYPADQPWLPAENVRLLEVITPEKRSHQVGDTLTHELLVHIDGNIGSISPPLVLALNENNFRIYPAAPIIEDDTNSGMVKGSRLQTNSIVPLQPGLLSVPATEIVWWDTKNHEVRVATTKAQTLNVTGTPVAPLNIVPPVEMASEQEEQPGQTIEPIEIDWKAWLPYVFGLIVAALLLFGARSLWQLYARPGRRTGTDQVAMAKLQQAYASNHTSTIANAFTAYLAHHYGCSRSDVMQRLRSDNEAAANVLAALNRSLYSAEHMDAANNDTLHEQSIASLKSAIEELHRPTTRSAGKDNQQALPELYPDAT